MVSPSSVTPSRRVTRSQSASDRKPNPKKTRRVRRTAPRYAEMSTDSELEEPESTDQQEAASTEPRSCWNTVTFPERLFARNCYLGKPRLNIYSKASIIGSLVKLLRGSPEMNCLLGSQFGALFHLPVSRCSNSAKLVHSLLSRQLVTIRLYELWFLFADKPLRFSLREFGDITSLKCEPEREKVGNGSESSDATPGRMWKKLFETEDEDVTVADVLRMLEQPSLPEWKRLPLALIALVDGLLVIVTYSIPDEGGDSKWEKEVIDPRIDNLVRGMREGHEFKATDFRGGDSSLPPLKPAEKGEGVGVKKKCVKPSRRFGKAFDEPGCLTQTPQRPIRPRRGIRKQAEPGNLSDKEQELKEWIRVGLKTQLGKLRDQIFDWLHHDRGGSFTVPQNTADGKTNRDSSHADPTGMEVPKKRRPYSGDGIDEAEKCGSDSKKHKKNNGDGFSEDETMRMHDNHCDGRTPNDRFWEKVIKLLLQF
ncbi:hypothetical protein Bca4012_024967 [Brassica carinata]